MKATAKRTRKQVSPRNPRRRPKQGRATAPGHSPHDCLKRALQLLAKLPIFRRAEGCAAILLVGERNNQLQDYAGNVVQVPLSLDAAGFGAKDARVQTMAARPWGGLAAAAHPQRLRILAKLLMGPGTYRTLRQTTGLKAGPLYHHVSQLRLAGLILPKRRDLYELTRAGRNLVLTACAAGALLNDQRRRPLT